MANKNKQPQSLPSEPPPQTTASATPAPPAMVSIRKGPLAVMALFLVAGIVVSLILIGMKLDMELGAADTTQWGCEKGSGCHAVQMSPHSVDPIFGLPIALFAVPTYLTMAFLAFLGFSAGKGESVEARLNSSAIGEAAVLSLLGIGILTCLHALYLFGVSVLVVGETCKYCMTLYAVNFGATICAYLAANAKLDSLISRIFGAIAKTPTAPVQAFVLFAVAIGASVVVYNNYYAKEKQHREQFAIAQAQQAFDEEFEDVEAPTNQAVSANTQGAAGTTAGTPAQGTGTATATPTTPDGTKTSTLRKPKPKMTENGLSFFEAAVNANDFALGPADAPVTVVKFADFECGYCRILDLNMRPLEEKYKTEVRWVMKHYPMNGDCNRRMGGERMHPEACHASFAAHCAGEQGKFWEMHKILYDNQQKLDKESVKGYAEKLGLDIPKWETCLTAPSTNAKIQEDIAEAAKAGIYGTPRAYVNGRLVSGSAQTSVLDYYIQKSLEEVKSAAQGQQEAAAAVLPIDKTPDQVKAKTAKGEFWIDAFECSIDKDGYAVSVPNVDPAQASWFDAKQACEKSGKRLCTEEEWVSACAGTPAVDDNNNRFFADDDVEGRMYPYGLFYEAGTCRDAEDEYKGLPGKTGSMSQCRTPDGIYDLAGNLMEWAGTEQADAALLGGDWRGGERSACNRRTVTFGPGQRNNTTGFRCCSDQRVEARTAKPEDLQHASGDIVGKPLPKFEVTTVDGTKFTAENAKNKITYLTFFASWCGSCKRELPELNLWHDELAGQGLQIVAVGVDKTQSLSENFVKQFEPKYSVAYDPDAITMGLFDINAMPTSFLIDRQGIVRHREVGFKKEETHILKKRVTDLLAQK